MSDSSSSSYAEVIPPPIVFATNCTTNLVGAPLDVRTVALNEAALSGIENPYVGMHVWLTEDAKEIIVTGVSDSHISSYEDAGSGGGSGAGYTRKLCSSDTAAVNKDWLICTANVTITLPSAVTGYFVKISSTGSANTVTVVPAAGNTIQALSTNFVLNYAYCTAELYADSNSNWTILEVH